MTHVPALASLHVEGSIKGNGNTGAREVLEFNQHLRTGQPNPRHLGADGLCEKVELKDAAKPAHPEQSDARPQ